MRIVCAVPLVWLRRLLEEIGVNTKEPTVLMEDNKGTIALAQNPVAHARTKHIDIRHHFIREAVQEGVVKIDYCPTEEMIADLLTKPLVKGQFEKFRAALGLSNGQPAN